VNGTFPGLDGLLLLLFTLFMVTSLFYAVVTHQSAPELLDVQKSQIDKLNNIEEFALSGEPAQ
jgi:hypothetical protein